MLVVGLRIMDINNFNPQSEFPGVGVVVMDRPAHEAEEIILSEKNIYDLCNIHSFLHHSQTRMVDG